MFTNDRSRYLYATWRQLQPPGFGVYIASTAPDLQQALGGLTASDLARITVETVFGMLTGATMSPLGKLYAKAGVNDFVMEVEDADRMQKLFAETSKIIGALK